MSQGRMRTRAACEPCRARKRKCDGQHPCALCVRYEYDCIYINQGRKRRGTQPVGESSSQPRRDQDSITPTTTRSSETVTSPEDHERNMVANAGSLFPYILGVRQASAETSKVCAIGWNLELFPPIQSAVHSPCLILSLDQCQTLVKVYFEKVHPVYAFIERSTFENRILSRWRYPEAPGGDFDAVICGVAVIGAVFGVATTTELREELADLAKSILERVSPARHPSIDLIRGWLLRTLYLRVTSTPQASWMTSCITMHLIEDTGLHQEDVTRSLIYPDYSDQDEKEEYRRRLFWISHLLNTWISQEYGRSTVRIANVNCNLPSPSTNNHTMDLITLFQISQDIDPEACHDSALLEQCLFKVGNTRIEHDAVKLSQSNLTLAIYRRLRSSESGVSSAGLSIIFRLGLQGLEAALRLANAYCPWWHVLNQPFQFTCILLAIDSKESLSYVSQTFSTLNAIANKFDNAATWKAVETAQLLIRICSERKQREATSLRELDFIADIAANQHIPSVTERASLPASTDEVDLQWSVDDAMFAQMIEEFDWDSFLDMPGSF